MHTFLSNYIFLSFLQIFWQRVLVVIAFDESAEITTAHFADPKRGRMSWIIDENALPWTGQYYYIESTQSPMTNLLIVVDSSNGNHLGNCASYAPRDNKWRRFFWTLTEDLLVCNITDTETTVSKIHFSSISSPRTFSLRILAQQGPRCFRDMIVQNEKLQGCPPKLQRNLFQAMSLECNCPISTTDSNFAHTRSDVAPFHFVNPRITSSDGNLSISRNLSLGIPKNTSNLNLIKTVTEIIPGINITTAIIDSTKIPITREKFVNSPVDIQQNNELAPSIIQESLASTATYEHLSSLSLSLSPSAAAAAAVASDMAGINGHACTGIQCQNNGTCIAGNDGRAVCMCHEGFLGSQCEINLCANVECMHGGICQANGNVPRCHCRPGTTGTFCEQLICNPRCEQGGICELTGNVPVCRCPTGTFGINCNIIDTCSNNNEACIEHDSDARCQLDSDNFALISPIPVNATYKCLCLNERSEWIDCKDLPKKIHFSTAPTAAATTIITPNPDALTSTLQSETLEQSQFTQHIASLFQNHPHLSNLFPNSFLSPSITNITTTAASSLIKPNQDFHPSDKFGIETFSSALNRPVELLPKLLATVPEPSDSSPFDTTTHIPILPTVSPLFVTSESSLPLHHHFNMTSETATIATATLSGNPKSRDSVNSTESIDDLILNPTGRIFVDISDKLKNENVTVESSRSSSVMEFLATASSPEMIINNDNRSVIQLSTLSRFATAISSTSVPTTMAIIDGDSSSTTQIDSSTPDETETDEQSISTSKTIHTIEDDNLSNQLMFTTTAFYSTSKIHEEEKAEKEENWNLSQGFTKSIEEMEQTTMEEFTEESRTMEEFTAFDEDKAKFVKLTVGLPTTTLIPHLNQPSGGAFSDNDDTMRSDTSSWTIVFAIIFALMILAGACTTLVFRYVRRSRKLHGKYNPAREESILSSSYSMPMATVTKEERLI